MARGKFITLEGGEGAGKTTQAAFLSEKLRRAGIDVFQTREPGGTPRAEAIRDILLAGKAKRFGALGEAVLFYAARESHLELAIRPALERGTWVVCDRFNDSTRAYQGAAGGLPPSVIEVLDRAVVGSTKPDLTIIFDIPPQEGLQRAAARKQDSQSGAANESGPDRFETMNAAFHRSLREEFLAIAKAEPERCVVVDASGDVQQVADIVWSIVRERLKL
ncbi:MAG: dTMP kinase [Rhodomicrobium sp.]|nr:dTMP kinase [Rhodomicrobium sp.]